MKLFKKGQLTLSAVTDDEAPSLDRREGRSVRNKVRTERRKNVKKNARIAKHCSHKEIADAWYLDLSLLNKIMLYLLYITPPPSHRVGAHC